jgi:preprotein translocase subunit YajC
MPMNNTMQAMPTPIGYWLLGQAGGVVTPALPAHPEAGAAPATSAPPATTGAPGSPAPAAPQSSPSLQPLLFLAVAMVLILVLPQIFGRKQQRKRAEMLAGIRKMDRVQTIGGVIGTVVELRDDEIVLKVDEGTNTRIRFAKAAVQAVLKSGGGPASSNGSAGAEVEVKAGGQGIKA